jgi:streptogramin lyase
VLQIDLATGKSLKWIQLPWGNGVHGITYAPRTRTLWVTALSVNALAEVDPKDFRILKLIPVKHTRAHGLDYDNGVVWCLFAADRVIHKLDAKNGKVLEVIRISPGDPDPHGLCLHEGHLYTCDAGLTATSAGSAPGYICRIDV